MPDSAEIREPDAKKREQTAALKKYGALLVGFIAIVLWVVLFTIGININSTYYRAAISYNYGDWTDWLMTVVSFTLSNVILLAFLSGFLGGICSKVIHTEGFTLSTEQLKANKHDSVLFENPAISAFRGVFVFIALLTFQYISSFSDLSSIGKDSETTPKQKDFNEVYYNMLDSMSDSASRQSIKQVWQNEQAKFEEENNDTLVFQIMVLRDSIKSNPVDGRINVWKDKIRELRTKIKLPDLADIPGLSASGYFRFAVIVSMLAFICGYDPKRFNLFIKIFPIVSKEQPNNKNVLPNP